MRHLQVEIGVGVEKQRGAIRERHDQTEDRSGTEDDCECGVLSNEADRNAEPAASAKNADLDRVGEVVPLQGRGAQRLRRSTLRKRLPTIVSLPRIIAVRDGSTIRKLWWRSSTPKLCTLHRASA